jgi:hypothetical protein
MAAARSRRNTDATYAVGGARWLVAKLIRFDHRSIRRPRPMVEALIEWSTPAVWAAAKLKRASVPGLSMCDWVPLLLDSTLDAVP